MEYLAHIRIDAAARLLLEEPKTSITEMAFSCGFKSSQYFATVFQRRLGSSPREWRRLRLSA